LARTTLLASIAVGFAMAAFAWLFSLTPAANRIESQYALGLLYRLRGPVEPQSGAVIIAIDKATLTWLRESAAAPEDNRWLSCPPPQDLNELSEIRGPGDLPRSVHACLLEQLRHVGFPVVAFDILFAVKGNDEDDARLARALREHGATAILVGIERSTIRDGGSELLVEREVQPLAMFRDSAAATGTFVIPRSGGPVYGFLRAVPGFEGIRSLPDEAGRLFRSPAEDAPPGKSAFEYLWLYGPPGSIETVSARDILSGEESDAVRSAASRSVAFVGASDPNTTDFQDVFPSFFRSGIGADISGVELAATAFLNAETGEILRRLPSAAEAALVVFIAFVFGFLARARAVYAMLAVPLTGMAYLLAAMFAFSNSRLLLPIGTPIFVVGPVAFVIAVFIRYRLARALIMRLAPAPAARRMLQRPTDHRSAAVAQDATVVFFDLIGSTAIAEKIPAVAYNALLSSYFDTVSDLVEKHRGLIATFSGDGITAVFTETDGGQNHAVRACHSVVAVLRSIGTINIDNSKNSLPPLHMRVGLNSGSVAEGEIGAHDRFNFSVVGDVVNLAARLEQLGKTLFPDEKDVVLVGEATHRMAAPAGLPFSECGVVQIRGREHPEQVYRLAINWTLVSTSS
jgi:adenylate cyclase